MSDKTQSLFPKLALSFALGAAAAALIAWLASPAPPAAGPGGSPSVPALQVPDLRYEKGLGELAPRPDWTRLNSYQGSLSPDRLEDELNRVYRTGDAWKETIALTSGGLAEIPAGDNLTYKLGLFGQTAVAGSGNSTPAYWRHASSLPPAPDDRPLEGLRLVLDPGHLGGKWAKMEGRWYQFKGGKPVMEGELTLETALTLKPKLEALGAEVHLTRTTTDCVSKLRPQHFLDYARSIPGVPKTPANLKRLSEKFFYRTWEIRERARIINETIKPDLTVCLHFNGDWKDANNPQLDDRNHFHVLINGTYSKAEYALDDQRFDMFDRILQGMHQEELGLADSVATAMARETGLPPFVYRGNNAQRVNDNPYVFARNLLANRVYKCPVVFLEPYMMSCVEVYERIQAGQYEGFKDVAGKKRKSIFHEYADGVAAGLAAYYKTARPREGEPE